MLYNRTLIGATALLFSGLVVCGRCASERTVNRNCWPRDPADHSAGYTPPHRDEARADTVRGIQVPVPEDYDEIIQLMAECFPEDEGNIKFPSDFLTEKSGYTTYVYIVDGVIASMVAIQRRAGNVLSDCIYVELICTHPDHRGRSGPLKRGPPLYALVLDRVVQNHRHGGVSFELAVRRNNRARKGYVRSGFRMVGQQDDYFTEAEGEMFDCRHADFMVFP